MRERRRALQLRELLFAGDTDDMDFARAGTGRDRARSLVKDPVNHTAMIVRLEGVWYS